jgi:outer membrane receptor for ferrienterochelin and colicins
MLRRVSLFTAFLLPFGVTAQADAITQAQALVGPTLASVNDTLPDHQFEQMVITGQFTPTDARQTVNSVRILDRKTIERRAALNLEELLQTEANLRLSQDPVLGSALTINGLRGENVKILVDGVPVVGRLNGSIDAGQLPLANVQQVEIIEGAQSLLYGSEASAGVINLVSRRSQAHTVEAEANAQLESNGFKNYQGRVGVRLGDFLLQVNGNQLEFLPQTDTAQGRDQLWNPKHQTNGRAMLRYSPSERLDIRLSGGRFSEVVDNLGILRRPQFKPYAFDDYYYTDRTDMTLQGEGWTRNRWFWQTTAGWNRFDRIKNSYRFNFDDESKELLAGQQDTSGATGLLARFTIASDRKDRRLNYLFGLENYTESAEGIRIVDSTESRMGVAAGNDLGVFGSVKYKIGTLTLQGGARWTQNRLYGSAITPTFWALWQPSSKVQWRFSYANGFRSPGLKELYFNFIDVNHYIVGNTDLRPERSNNFRTDLRWTALNTEQHQLNVNTAGFYNLVRDRIILAEFDVLQYQYANLSKWETTGGGLGFSYQYKDRIRFRTDAVNTAFFNTFSTDNDSLPKFKWAVDWVNELTISAFDQRANLTVWHKLTGRTPFFYEELGEVKQGVADSWHLLNAAVNVNFCKNTIRLNAGVKNILDRRLIQTGTSNEPGHQADGTRPVHWGRTYFVSLTTVLGWR